MYNFSFTPKISKIIPPPAGVILKNIINTLLYLVPILFLAMKLKQPGVS